MPEPKNDTVKINRVLTTPKKGLKLGTTSAAWKKIKSAAASAPSAKDGIAEATLPKDDKTTGDDTAAGVPSDLVIDSSSKIVLSGPKGEIFIVYTHTCTIEIWGWEPAGSGATKSKAFQGETLYLLAQYTPRVSAWLDDFHCVESAQILAPSPNANYKWSCILVIKSRTRNVRKVVNLYDLPKGLMYSRIDVMPALLISPLTVKLNDKFLILSNQQGYIQIFRWILGIDSIQLVKVNHGYCLQNLRQSSSQPIINLHPEWGTSVTDDDLILQTSCFDSKPIFDIVGSWLVYSPTDIEYHHLKNMKSSLNNNGSDFRKDVNTPSDAKDNRKANGDISRAPQLSSVRKSSITSLAGKHRSPDKPQLFTPVKLPPPGPLLNRVVSTLSNSALDGLFKLSEIGSQKVKRYMQKSKSSPDQKKQPKLDKEVVIPLNSIGKAIGKALYSTASSFQHPSKNNDLIKIVDLNNGRIMSFFKPPGGVSALSLSPYDLQLIHANLRGDNFYMWDLYKAPNEVSLVGKFQRGKTSAIIEEIFWFINTQRNNLSGTSITSNNSGFGCITKKSGSVHWYNVNYLSCGNMTNNLPNILGASAVDQDTLFNSTNFLDSWILSSFGAQRFLTLPNFSGNAVNPNKENDTHVNGRIQQDDSKLNQLAVLDRKNQLRLVAPLNGAHGFKYTLPTVPVDDFASKSLDSDYDENTANGSNNYDDITPLSQTEIETCAPYLNLINNRCIEFSTYDFETDDDYECLVDLFSDIGSDIPVHPINFGGKRCQGDTTNESDNEVLDSLLNKFSGGFTVDQEEAPNEAGDALKNGDLDDANANEGLPSTPQTTG